jgi:Na+/H+ antiporter NhaD/arsenite permease-like protein
MCRRLLASAVLLLACPAPALAAGDNLHLPAWSIIPFALLLLAIAVLPLVAEHWWHHNRNKAIVSGVVAVPTVLGLIVMQITTQEPTLRVLANELIEYVAFIVLLGSLYVVSGGIVLAGDLEGKPLVNTLLLVLGAVLASAIGTTGASVLLIRPLLRINKHRRHKRHLPIFFIFIVSNLGGLLTPLGDPPLFLGFLNGVPFFWTMSLWRQWLCANGLVLAIFLVWETLAYRGEEPVRADPIRPPEPLAVRGLFNGLLLLGVIAGVLVQGWLAEPWGHVLGCLLMAAMAGLSLWLTPQALRVANAFTWEPILEVAILFLGIFITMVPALAVVAAHKQSLDLTEPWQFFWLTGVLSAFLDNAPTYVSFATMATGSSDYLLLVHNQVPGLADGPLVLAAISCGAVFMGALTYIGNGPNFMVKAIADQAGYRMPSFLGYLAYSCPVLLPVLLVITLLFFRPG